MIIAKITLYRTFLCLISSVLALTAGAHTGQPATDTMPSAALGSQYAQAAALDRIIAAESRSTDPGGEILVARRGQIVYRKTFGMANMELAVPMRENMVFHIGSLSKQMTAVAILQLMEQGKLSLQDDIRKYLPEFQVLADTVTIEHLLTHTSGLAETGDPTITARGEKTPHDLVMPYKNQAPLFAAGTQWKYNNANYYLLGYIIEQLSGKSYASYLKENIFQPAGMQHTCFCSIDTILKNKATGYAFQKRKGLVIDRIGSMQTLYASGGIQSTVEDMLRWNQAIKANILVRKETMARALTSFRLKNGQDSHYGYGWHTEDIHGSPSLRHGGAVPGFLAEELYLPREDVFVIALFNSMSMTPTVALTRMIAAEVIGKPYSFKEIALDRSLLQTYSGVYENEHKELIIITEADNKLYFQRPGGARYQIKASSADNFFFDQGYLWVAFGRNATSQVERLSFSKVDLNKTDWFKTSLPIPALLSTRMADSALDGYAGRYLLSTGDTITIEKEGLGLLARVGRGEKQPLYAATADTFIPVRENARFAFRRSRMGTVDLLAWYQGKEKKAAKRLP